MPSNNNIPTFPYVTPTPVVNDKVEALNKIAAMEERIEYQLVDIANGLRGLIEVLEQEKETES